jgi:hypothetical protein
MSVYLLVSQQDLQLWGGGAIKMRRPISVKTNLRYASFVVDVISYTNSKYNLTFRDLGEANVSIKSVDSISVLWRPRGDRRGRSPFNPALTSFAI